jgi:D-arabinan exo alpha-(1,3)/(1,5)-arabinofuranosidase (non-reducing end)
MKPGTNDYLEFSTPFAGMPQVILSEKQPRFGLYRWHVMDPIRFEKDLRVTIQALGWQSEGRYLPLKDDLSSVAYWYQKEPHNAYPKLPEKKDLLYVAP